LWLADVSQREQSSETVAMSPDPFLRGRALLQAGAHGEAADSLAEAVAENPEFAPAHAAWSEAAYALGSPVEARARAERAITLDPTYAKGYLQRARVTGWIERNWSLAERDLETALALTPDAPDVLLAMAELYLLTGRREPSVAMTDALRQSPSPSAHVLAALGRLHRLQQRQGEAEDLCRQAATQQPGLVAAQECLYRIALVRRDSDAARTIVPALAAALGASDTEIATFTATEATNELAAFERWRLGQTADPVTAAYSSIVLLQFDEAMYLLQQARDGGSGRLPAALHDMIFVGLFHQSAYGELCQSIGVVVPRFQ
jgi:Flp pilus assembly protein TadD